MTLAPECFIKWDGLAASAVLFALPLAVFITWLTLFWYRKRIAAAMRRAAGERVSIDASRTRAPAAELRISTTLATPSSNTSPLLAQSSAAMRKISAVYVSAGVVHSLIITLLYFWLNDLELRPIRSFIVWLPYAWPIILTINLTALATNRARLTTMAIYFAALVATDAAADFFGWRYHPGFGELIKLWLLLSGVPTLVILLLANRAWRAVGLIALFFAVILVASYLAGFQGLGCWLLSTRNLTLLEYFNYFLLVIVLLCFIAGWWLMRHVVRRYNAKQYSDQMLAVDSLWLVMTTFEVLSEMSSLGTKSFAFVIAFIAYLAVVNVGLRKLSSASQTPFGLLMLRVFGFTSRTRTMTDQIGHYWRYNGPINMIGGTDLATALIEPDELFRFWSGKLRQQFIASASDLAARLQALDITRDPDHRYRVNEFFCHDNTWQAAVKALAEKSAAVLMDLRGFGAQNRGCEFELEMLLGNVPLARVVLLIDGTTEIDALSRALLAAWAKLPESSPNLSLHEPTIRLYRAQDNNALMPLLSILYAAVAN